MLNDNKHLNYVPSRIKDARVAREMTQKELADNVGVTKGAISQYETGSICPQDSVMRQVSIILNYPLPYFLNEPMPNIAASSATYFRSLKSTSVKQREASKQMASQVAELVVAKLKNYVRFPQLNIPTDEVVKDNYSLDDCEAIAISLREYWGLGVEPITNMVEVLQDHGFILSRISLKNDKIDGFSKWERGDPYIFISDSKSSSVRFRFSLAHELGHLLLHTDRNELTPSKYGQLESEADMFASAFLMPQTSFFKDVSAPSLEHLLYLKKKWKVSVAAMVKKCKDHDVFSQEQCTSLYRQLSYRGWRKSEPLDDICEYEHPYLLKQALGLVLENNIISVNDIETVFCIYPEELAEWCYAPIEMVTPPKSNNYTPNLKLL